MNGSKFAWVILFLLPVVVFASPWVTGIENEAWPDALRWALLVAFVVPMIILGREESRREKEEDTWVDDPRKSRLENWLEKRRQHLSPKRGLGHFLLGLVAFSILIGINALTGSNASLGVAVAFILGTSALAGVLGMFTKKVLF